MENDNKKPDNPNAFPCVDGPHYLQEGMTLRDYFAAKAMQTIVTDAFYSISEDGDRGHEESVAIKSYRMADEMLKQREL